MNELDFLPDWYRADRQRKLCRHRHVVLFGLVAALMAGWSFIVGQSVSGLQAQTQQVETTLENGRETLQAAMEMELAIEQLDGQVQILETLTPRTMTSAVLAELSHTVNEQIVFSKVTLLQEPAADGASKPGVAAQAVVRLNAAKPAEAVSALPDGPQRTRITLTGIAAGGADVAHLIERLESSAYFGAVSPGFSRAVKIGDKDVTEFEITCIVADYTVQR